MKHLFKKLVIVLAVLISVSCAVAGCSSGTDNAGVSTVSGSGK